VKKTKLNVSLLAAALLAAVVVTPTLGSAAGLANTPFYLKATNLEKPSTYAIKPLIKAAPGATPTSPSSGSTPVATSTPVPTASPTPTVPDTTVTMRINTAAPGCTASNFYLNIPTNDGTNAVPSPRGTIDYGDASQGSALTSGTNRHAYAAGKQFDLKIKGTLPGFTTVNADSVACIESVTHFGQDTGILSLYGMFQGAKNLKQVAAPPTTVTNASYMLNGASAFNGDTSDWRLPNLKTAEFMFYGATSFAGDLSQLGPSSLTSSYNMFGQAKAFNSNISSWSTSNVGNMNSMFSGAAAFNQDISTWDTKQVTSMSSMFNGATAFEQNISNWNVTNVRNYTNFGANSPLAANPERMPSKFRPV